MNGRWSRWRRIGTHVDETGRPDGVDVSAPFDAAAPFDVAEDDPLLLHLQQNPGTVSVKDLDLESPALDALREAGIDVVVPLVSQGELIGVLNLGSRRSERPYSLDDRRLLDNLAGNAAAAIRVAHLVRNRAEQAQQRERIDNELKVAQLIQQQFLPQEAPAPEGWTVTPHYRPAREVGGDFYDFIPLPEGRIGLVVGDVTDKGVPAAMVMATTHSILRSDAPRLVDPGAVLSRANDLLCAEMPPNMFVTCLYAVLDPATGHLRFANAGHNLPCIHSAAGVVEPRATGMPLGLIPGLTYDEQEATIEPDSAMLLYSDGLVEAHNTAGELYGFPRLRGLMAGTAPEADVIHTVLSDLEQFTGSAWEQEDDITLVSIARAAVVTSSAAPAGPLVDFEVASDLGNERLAADRVVSAVAPLGLATPIVDRVHTVVAEATMNAIEHGNECRSEVPVRLRVSASDEALTIEIVDQGGAIELPPAETPDLEAKLAGLQTPRGWGLYLMRAMVDDLEVRNDGDERTVELTIRLDSNKETVR
jgi:serine phosphatase RsbU (regulator of sigma subunit)/anti-sigma regulatory factor (Ser/Thr protein kinase)